MVSLSETGVGPPLNELTQLFISQFVSTQEQPKPDTQLHTVK